LRKELLTVPEANLDDVPLTAAHLLATARPGPDRGQFYAGPAVLVNRREDLSGLPFLAGNDCHLSKQQADDLGALAGDLHGHVAACTSTEGTDAAALRARLDQQRAGPVQWQEPRAVPALLQILQAEDAPIRLLLIDLLGKIDAPRATAALAMRAMVDVSAEVRQAAVRGLARRPLAQVRKLLLVGLRYPWPPAVDHAAEALVALRDTEAVPALEELLEERPPLLVAQSAVGRPDIRGFPELVRVNHLKNCVLCHAPSFDATSPVRGLIPVAGRAPGTGRAYYDGGPQDLFVRADVTYLRQDFSLRQPVARPFKDWPKVQRYDYLVRIRPPTVKVWERAQAGRVRLTEEYRAAITFALRELRAERTADARHEPPG
jgi:hypothetical protein